MKRTGILCTKDLSAFLHSVKQQEAIKILGLNYKTLECFLCKYVGVHTTNTNCVCRNLKHKHSSLHLKTDALSF